MAIVMVVVDGMDDEPLSQLGNKTPWQAAQCYGMEGMKRKGAYGKLNACPQGKSVDSLNCILTLLAVPVEDIPQGRSYLEALACGIDLHDNDVVFRCNLVQWDRINRLQSSCGGGLSEKQMEEMAMIIQSELNSKTWNFFHMGKYKNLLIYRGNDKDIEQVVTYAPHQHMGCLKEYILPQGGEIAQQLTRWIERSQQCLSVWNQKEIQYSMFPWAMSQSTALPNFSALHGFQGAVISATEVVQAIGIAMGMIVPNIVGATGDIDTDLQEKTKQATRIMKQVPFVLLHLNGADEASHRKNVMEKVEFLKQVDTQVIRPLIKQLDDGDQLLVCSDHQTLVEQGSHGKGCVPFYYYQKGDGYIGNVGELQGGSLIDWMCDNIT